MEDLHIEGTTKTPEIHFEASTGILEIKGRSIPEISVEFYQAAINWLKDYIQSPQDTTVFNARLEYFNTSSSKSILDLFKILEELEHSGKKVKINWFHIEEDESMEEAGEEYKILLQLPFEILAVESL
ncbi:MAG TPA: DUF1987 domain-containing protein [Flavobacteriales bacterium]|nr:DUF1987 domain-containing protein [Flavobacteriales bacterium]HRE97227.1 DUF1987 domain-containing protein [Flavobacteriales bacterium]